MKALVIGGTGPTGPFIVEGLLKKGYHVAILHRGVHETELPEEVEHIHSDPHFTESITQALGTRTFDLVIAMYGRIRHIVPLMKDRTPRLIAIGGLPYQAIIDGFKNIVGPPIPLSEDAPLVTDESINKFTYLMTLTEQVVMEAHKQGQFETVIFRYPMIYGPRQLAPREWSIIRRILDGRKQIIIPNDGLKLLSRGYIENMAHAVLLAVDQPDKSAGQIYNVRDERLLSVREWIYLIAASMGSELEMVSIPFDLAHPSRPYTGRSHHEVLDINKIKTQLGYRDIVDCEEAIRRTVSWYLTNRPEPGGEVERQLGDSFDYDIEDRVIQEYRDFLAPARERVATGFKYRHPYPHPKTQENK